MENAQKYFKELEAELQSISDVVERKKAMARLERTLIEYDGEDKVISSLELVEQIKNRPPVQKIKTGFTDLDNILDGFTKKQLVVVAAPTKAGKTSFCIDLTIRLKEYNPVWFPFEEPAEELLQKFIDRGDEPPLFYTPQKNKLKDLEWIERKIIEARAKYDSQIVFIDHLHFVIPFSVERQDLVIGQTMRDLKTMAKRLNVVIVLIAHLKKTRLDKQPDLEDLRDSSFIAQEADTVMILWRKTRRNDEGEVEVMNELNVSVQANRRTGKTGNVKLMFDKGRFIKVDSTHEPKSEEWWEK